MSKFLSIIPILIISACATNGGLSDEEFAVLKKNSSYELMQINTRNYTASLNPNGQLNQNIALAKFFYSNIEVEKINPQKKYQVVLQIGHYPRKSGATGSSGKLVNEQEASALIVGLLAEELSELGIDGFVTLTALSLYSHDLRFHWQNDAVAISHSRLA